MYKRGEPQPLSPTSPKDNSRGSKPQQNRMSSPPPAQNTPNPHKPKREIPKNSWHTSYAPFHIMVIGPKLGPRNTRVWGRDAAMGQIQGQLGPSRNPWDSMGSPWDPTWDLVPRNPNGNGTLAKKSHRRGGVPPLSQNPEPLAVRNGTPLSQTARIPIFTRNRSGIFHLRGSSCAICANQAI